MTYFDHSTGPGDEGRHQPDLGSRGFHQPLPAIIRKLRQVSDPPLPELRRYFEGLTKDGRTTAAALGVVDILRTCRRAGVLLDLARHFESTELEIPMWWFRRSLTCLAENPEVSLGQIDELGIVVRDMEQRFLDLGGGDAPHSGGELLNAVHLAPRIGDRELSPLTVDHVLAMYCHRSKPETAREARVLGLAPRPLPPVDHLDVMYRCLSGIATFLVEWWIFVRPAPAGADHPAVRFLEHIYKMEEDDPCSACLLGPQIAYAAALNPALDSGREDLARRWLDSLANLDIGHPRWLHAAGCRALAHARLGEPDAALNLLEQHTWPADDPGRSPWARMWFHHHAALASALIPGHRDRIPDHRTAADALAQAFDRRNGNDAVSQSLKTQLYTPIQ